MHLERCKDQPSKTLDEFYQEIAAQEQASGSEGGKAMLELIARLRTLPDQRRIWGLTSHHRLCLLARNTAASPWYVIVAALDPMKYFIEYLMPPAIAPWPTAYVRGEADSEEEAVKMVITAMEMSNGWSDV